MKIKVPNYEEFNITERNYFIVKNKIFVCKKDKNFFVLDKKGERVILPVKHYIDILKIETGRKVLSTGILLITN